MIRHHTYWSFITELQKKRHGLCPTSAQIELTYRCNLDCLHCYCRGSAKKGELSTAQWKGIIDQLHKAGVMWLTITGGEPLLREDLIEIYSYAKKKGFFVSLFTNGILSDDKIIDYLSEESPFSIEITLNGITKGTYEAISQVKGSFEKALVNIEKIASKKLPLVLKAVGLKQNKGEIHDIKRFTEKLLGKKKFKFDSFITPKLNGDRSPCRHRLSAEDILKIEEADPDMRRQREEEFKKHQSSLRECSYKYHCNSWFNQFYITPYGHLRFCRLSDRYSTDLKKKPFTEGFYGKFPAILEEKYSSSFKCMRCSLREFCYHCPARAFLETGREDLPVDWFCELAKMTTGRIKER